MNRIRPYLLLALALLASTGAEAQGFRVKKATVNAVPEKSAFAAGETARIGVVMTIESGWHTNSHQPTFEYLIPTELTIDGPPGWRLDRVDYPAGQLKTFAFEDEPLSVYEGEVTLIAHLLVPTDALTGPAEGSFSLRYQACDDRSCLPPVTESQPLGLVVGAGGVATGIALDMPATEPPVQPTGLAWMLVLGLVGGLILNAMPCVLPVLSLKVLGLVKSAGQSRRAVTFGALATAAGILASFWALAGAAIIAKSAGSAVGWGVQFQEPAFVTALAVIVLLFTLNLWGVFEIPLPARLANAAAGGPSEGLAGHLAAGLFATLMATPCSAPFLGTAVGFGLAQPPLIILAVFTAIGLGMGLPYLVLAAFPGAARLLPKPGAWMNTLKVVMGFLLAAAAVWLFYVLSAQIAPERLAFVQLLLLTMAALIWLASQAKGSVGRFVLRLGTAATIVAAVWMATAGDGAARASASTETASLIAWTPFDRTEAEALHAEDRLVFVDVTADWCFTCKVNERLVLETPEVAEVFSQHSVIAMKADWTNRSDAIADFLADHGRYGIPFYLLYRPGAEPLIFSELLTKESITAAVREAAGS